MQKISLICFSLCAAQFAQAGPLMSILKKKDAKHYQFVRVLTAGYANAAAAKTTTLKERVTAQNYMGQGDVDSTRFIYNAGNHNGSQFDYNAVEYPIQFSYANGPFLEGVNGNHARPYVFANVAQEYNNQNGAFGPSDIINITYDANNNIAIFGDSSLSNQGQGFTMSYISNYSQQAITNSTALYTFSGQFDTASLTFFRYNQGRIVADSVYRNVGPGSLGLENRDDYTYDNAGNLTQLLSSSYDAATQAITPSSRYTNTYTSDNRLKTSISETYNGTGWETEEVDSFGYTTNIPYYTYMASSYTGSSIPSILNYHTTAAGAVDSIYGSVDTGSGGATSIKLLLVLDSYNNPVTAGLYYGSGTTFPATPSERYSYYYETYQPSAVANVASTGSNVRVYPNPATNTLYVSGLTGGANQISLVNMAGQVAMTQATSGDSAQAVSMAGIAPGNYVLRVTTTNGALVHVQSVVKQ